MIWNWMSIFQCDVVVNATNLIFNECTTCTMQWCSYQINVLIGHKIQVHQMVAFTKNELIFTKLKLDHDASLLRCLNLWSCDRLWSCERLCSVEMVLFAFNLQRGLRFIWTGCNIVVYYLYLWMYCKCYMSSWGS